MLTSLPLRAGVKGRSGHVILWEEAMGGRARDMMTGQGVTWDL